MSLNVAHVIQGVSPEGGGPSQVVLQLAEAQAQCGVNTTIICERRRGDWQATQQLIDQLSPSGKVRINAGPPGPTIFGHSLGRRAAHAYREQIKTFDVLHLHGIWSGLCLQVARITEKHALPYVLCPHGMLEPWSLEYRSWKKRLALPLLFRPLIEKAAAIHVTGDKEARGLKQLKLVRPTALLPNGVNLPTEPANARQAVDQRWSELAGKHIALFIGRLHTVKGLEHLIPAWAKAHANHPDWHLVLAGPDENGYRARVEQLIGEHDVADSVTLPGPVWGEEKDQLLSSAELLVGPSLQENFGVSIAEGLAVGMPAITTDQTPWQDLVKHECGWLIPVGVDPLVAALDEAMAMPADQRRAMGRRGRQLIESKYTWPSIAEQSLALYRWVCGGGPAPDCLLDDARTHSGGESP